MLLSERHAAFLEHHHAAAMITVGPDGLPRAVRVGIALVDGKLWSSGTQSRVRTERLRRDPRCVLFVFDPGWSSLTLESTVTILEGPDVPAQTVRLFRVMQSRPSGPLSWFGGELEEEAFREEMVREKRLIYEFEVGRSYGLV
jgi:PPOX class probable F420-dependent enzyme